MGAGGDPPLTAQKYADVAKERNPNALIIYISSIEIQSKGAKVQYWDQTLLVPNTLKIHCVKVHNWYQLKVPTVPSGEGLVVTDVLKKCSDI